MKKYTYFFSSDYIDSESTENMIDILGKKGYGLAQMSKIGIPVPPGFTISSELCIIYLSKNEYPSYIEDQIIKSINKLELLLNKKFGGDVNPLLVSVRSGSKISMPGMMDTVLNLGLNDKSVIGLSNATNNEWFAYDCYRRFISMFGNVVLNINNDIFEKQIEMIKYNYNHSLDSELSINELKVLIKNYKDIIYKYKNIKFPQDPYEQLFMTINAVLKSWNNNRAKIYRKINNIPNDLGTAVNIQSMVYGNRGVSSGTGVVFTRNPLTGKNCMFGEYLTNAQGEDIVSGIRTPNDIIVLKQKMPLIYNSLKKICKILEYHFKDMQDIEFTIEENKLYILQSRTGKRTSKAAIKIAVDMVLENLIDEKTAILRIEPKNISNLLHKAIDTKQKYNILFKGLPASPGAASGKIVLSSEKAEYLKKKGECIILILSETSSEDINGMYYSDGFITVNGGMTSHAAVISRGIGKPCIVGCNDLRINLLNSSVVINNNTILKEGDYITIDGNNGYIIQG